MTFQNAYNPIEAGSNTFTYPEALSGESLQREAGFKLVKNLAP